MTESFIPVLQGLGYKLRRCSGYYQTTALYRGGSDPSSLVIYPDGQYHDFVTGDHGNIKKLVSLTLKHGSTAETEEWLKNKDYQLSYAPEEEDERLLDESQKFFPDESLRELNPDYSYGLSRGIKEEVLKKFKTGTFLKGRLAGRFCAPIFNKEKMLLGYYGRAIKPELKPKQKLIGKKSNWNYPLFWNIKDIRATSRIILVESVFDALSLYTLGIKDVFVLFGVSISQQQLVTLLTIDPARIIIALNNDKDGNSAGNNAAQRLYELLVAHFDCEQVKICLPPLKDFNECLLKDPKLIENWAKGI